MKLTRPAQLVPAAIKLYQDGLRRGDLTGWPELDKFYTVVPGYLTILTGWPGSGKSEWLDALMMNLAPQGWKFVVYSPENLPLELHLSKWLEKLWNKPFGDGPTERMSIDEVKEGIDELGKHFHFTGPSKDEAVSVYSILESASVYFDDDIMSGMKHGLVIDPWNEIEHGRPVQMAETEYVSKCLGGIRSWARERNVHVWLVAHPQKLRRLDTGKLPIPTPDTISGSQNFWNKADCAITVHRDLTDLKNPDVEIYVQKMRFKHMGHPGVVTLRYSRLTGRYSQIVKSFTVVKDDDDGNDK